MAGYLGCKEGFGKGSSCIDQIFTTGQLMGKLIKKIQCLMPYMSLMSEREAECCSGVKNRRQL